MIEKLRLLHLPADIPVSKTLDSVFVLATCQRTLLLGIDESKTIAETNQHILDDLSGDAAYSFLLETICGLKSQVLGEYEVVAQFKQAYSEYVQNDERNPQIMRILEKLFKDAKTVRSSHLLEIGSHTYGGLARKLLIKHCPEQKGRVLILGSGKLAEESLKLLTRKFDVYLSARNFERVATLHDQHGIRPVEWYSPQLYKEFSLIINTIGSHDTIYKGEFFESWANCHDYGKRAFIDLGSPSAINTKLENHDGIYRLDDVFAYQEELDEQKKIKLADAKAAIKDLVDRRTESFSTSSILKTKDMELV